MGLAARTPGDARDCWGLGACVRHRTGERERSRRAQRQGSELGDLLAAIERPPLHHPSIETGTGLKTRIDINILAIYNIKMNNICPRCKKEFESKISKIYCTEYCRRKEEKRRNRRHGAGARARRERYEAWLTEQIPQWNAARIARLDAAAAKRAVLARVQREKEEARLARSARFRANPVRVSSEVIGRLEAQSMPEPNSGCRLWLGEVHDDGYGRISVRNRMRRVHRVAYAAWVSPLPNGQRVLHRCDQPTCINPDHLYVGTAKDNVDDMVRRGRWKPERVNGRFAKRDG